MDLMKKIERYLNEAKAEKTFIRLNLKDVKKWTHNDPKKSNNGYLSSDYQLFPEFIKANYKVRDQVTAPGAPKAYLKGLTAEDMGPGGKATGQLLLDISSEDYAIWRYEYPIHANANEIGVNLKKVKWTQSKINDLVNYFRHKD